MHILENTNTLSSLSLSLSLFLSETEPERGCQGPSHLLFLPCKHLPETDPMVSPLETQNQWYVRMDRQTDRHSHERRFVGRIGAHSCYAGQGPPSLPGEGGGVTAVPGLRSRE
jgi:hypothetical protein